MPRILAAAAVTFAFTLACLPEPVRADNAATITPIIGHGGQCLDLPFAGTHNGNNLWMWPCNRSNAQRWVIKDNVLRVKNHCLDVEGPFRHPRTFAQIWDCQAVLQHLWTITVAGQIISKFNGLCLDVQWGGRQPQTPVWLWTCNGTSAQRWIFKAPDVVQKCEGRFVKSVHWDFTDKGLVLRVDPTTFGRWAAGSFPGRAWRNVLNCKPPRYESWSFDSAASETLKHQFECHAAFSAGAFGKYTGGERWDLENWRRPSTSLKTWANKKCNW